MMVNLGYQEQDKHYINYHLWTLPGINLHLRGPRHFDPNHYFVSIGAAQTFGRFCHDTYTSLLSRWLNISAVNLGFSGAGPSYFFLRPALIDLINASRFCIVQVMSGRSLNNSRFELGPNQGLSRPRGSSEDYVFAEHAYARFLEHAHVDDIIALRTEIQNNYVSEYIHLASLIRVTTI